MTPVLQVILNDYLIMQHISVIDVNRRQFHMFVENTEQGAWNVKLDRNNIYKR